MPPPTENPADCEKRTVIRFLSAKGVEAAEVHREISEVYGENIRSSGMVRKWAGVFNYGRTNVHDVEGIGRSAVITKDLVQNVYKKSERLQTLYHFIGIK